MVCAAGDFDYGGAAFMGPLLTDYNVSAPRELLKVGGKFWFTNFAQPLRDACEPPPGKPHDCCWHLGCILPRVAAIIVRTGATGLASSTDGIDWQRASAVSPRT